MSGQRIVAIGAGSHSGALNSAGELFLFGTGAFGQYLVPIKVNDKTETQFIGLHIGNNFGFAIDSSN